MVVTVLSYLPCCNLTPAHLADRLDAAILHVTAALLLLALYVCCDARE
jgi:hypothetical protein